MKTIRVAAAIIREENQIFATARGYGEWEGWWEFPGGKIEPGETPQQALRREIREELETEIEVGEKLHTIEYDYPKFHLSMDCFWCSIRTGQLNLLEAEDARWLTIETLRSVKWLPADLELIDMIERKMGSIATSEDEVDITEQGNPGKPEGEYGRMMLADMNEHHTPVTEWGLGFLHVKADAQLLDIGCGGGATLRRLAGKAPEGKICGIDYSETSVGESTAFNRDLIEAGRMEIVSGSVEAMPFGDGTFDGITTVESFYFWPDPVENLKEVCRVLRPGGTFLLIADIYGGYDFDEHTLDNIRKYNLFNPTPEEFAELLRQAGFSKIMVHMKEGTSWICVEGIR